MTSYQDISSFIWGIADDVLRGLFKQHEYGDVILPFVTLRRLDCVLEPQKDEVVRMYADLKDRVNDPSPIIFSKTGLNFYNRSNYDLQRLKGAPNQLRVNFPYYLNGYSQNVSDILENFQLEKPVEKLIKNGRLYYLIDKLTEVDLHPDKVSNQMMGGIFEELLRKFSEISNETSGEHYTPRDIVRLLVSLVFSGAKENLEGEGNIRSIFDPCCGTGGMLTIGNEWIRENVQSDIKVHQFGQELNPATYAICKSDFLITGDDPNNIKFGNSLSNDQFEGERFDFLITNPPFGVSWKSDQEFIQNEAQNPMGRFSVGTPRVSDGSLLFLQHMISKMKERGSRIGIVFNGSPLFTGDAGSGESNIRQWIIENDWLEAIVALPDQLFFNTGISTYLWIVTNKKKEHRKGKVQLIDGTSFFHTMKKSLGSKRKYITEEQRKELVNIHERFEEGEFSKIYNNEFFGYTKVVIEQPLVEDGKIIKDRQGNLKSDSSLRDSERVPLTEDIDEYFEREVKPHLPDAWMDRDKDKIGYEINFTKYFYKYEPLRSLEEITQDLLQLEEESEGLFKQLMGE